jgi:hypothetical protein
MAEPDEIPPTSPTAFPENIGVTLTQEKSESTGTDWGRCGTGRNNLRSSSMYCFVRRLSPTFATMPGLGCAAALPAIQDATVRKVYP